MTINPINNYILIEREKSEDKSKGGILLPEKAREVPVLGKVLACRESYRDNGEEVAMPVKPGDLVIFTRYGGREFKIRGEEFYMISINEILAILEE